MPTAADYARGAETFRGAIETVDEHKDEIRNADLSVVVRGECYLKSLIERTIGASVDNISAVSKSLGHLEEECMRRKTICDAYDDAIRRYNKAWRDFHLMREGPTPQLPPRPAYWVEASVEIEG